MGTSCIFLVAKAVKMGIATTNYGRWTLRVLTGGNRTRRELFHPKGIWKSIFQVVCEFGGGQQEQSFFVRRKVWGTHFEGYQHLQDRVKAVVHYRDGKHGVFDGQASPPRNHSSQWYCLPLWRIKRILGVWKLVNHGWHVPGINCWLNADKNNPKIDFSEARRLGEENLNDSETGKNRWGQTFQRQWQVIYFIRKLRFLGLIGSHCS